MLVLGCDRSEMSAQEAPAEPSPIAVLAATAAAAAAAATAVLAVAVPGVGRRPGWSALESVSIGKVGALLEISVDVLGSWLLQELVALQVGLTIGCTCDCVVRCAGGWTVDR